MNRNASHKGVVLSFFSLFVLLVAAPSQAGISEDGIWSDTERTEKSVTEERPIKPLQYRLIALDQERLEMTLLQMQSVTKAVPPVLLTVPTPDGEFERFEITPSQVMHPDLAARYPEIRAYKGIGYDNPAVWIRFEWSPSGFHALVRGDRGTFYIDPYVKGDKSRYMSYYRRHFMRNFKDMEPEAPPLQARSKPVTGDISSTATRVVTSGSQLRTYRLALAATGEYTAKFGGTKEGALADMTTAINRVSGIFENEFAVGLQLIDNTDVLIYTDAASDPYTNYNGGAMLDENQINLDNVIGSANYDIGHVFSTGGGGIAMLEVPCWVGYKAQGVTGLSNPTGDPYYVDYVAHEMGHQMGANHTFNSTEGSCGGGNRNAATAFEPGSGSTIMAYAGICGTDDVQSSSTTAGGVSDDYFHVRSIEEIVANISNPNPGYGGSCGTVTFPGNTPPTAIAGGGGFTIPARTPFQLTGDATDPDGTASLTYAWEQYDLGAAGGPPSNTSTTGPMFRSREGSTSPTRYFPKLSDILSGNYGNTWEVLPSVSRTLTFQLTVRDNSPSVGGVDSAQISFSVDGSSGPFRVTSQNSPVSYQAGDAVQVTWDVANTASAPVSCSAVDIRLSADSGQSFAYSLASNTPNDGSETINMPSVETTAARIQVACHNNIFLDIADSNFTITIPVAYSCSGANPVVASKTFTTGEEVTCTGTSSVSTSGIVSVSSGATVNFVAPVVNMNPGFSAVNGASFSACTSAPCP